MTQWILKIDGMACGMCEAHINDAIRQHFQVKKVTSSHSKGETVILTEHPIKQEELAAVIAATGYKLLSVEEKPYEKKKGFFHFLRKE